VRDWHRPSWWGETAIPALVYRYYDVFSKNGAELMDEDWDTLFLLDACRFDLFEETNTIPGKLGHRISEGSNTPEFFEANFADSKYYDTVYVTANPVPRVEEWCSVDVDAVFHEVIDVWQDNWDGSLNTVRPEPVVEAIREAHNDYPNKRIFGHFIQPHQPFIGESGKEIDEKGMRAYKKLSGEQTETGKKVFEQLEAGDLSTERVWQAYRENLELVLPNVEDLCNDLTGKIVVTSDHGNMFGEFAWPFPIRQYGHPENIHTKALTKVPWLEPRHESRREIIAEAPGNTDLETDREETLERLEHLGYR
jgi:hypothetical protein